MQLLYGFYGLLTCLLSPPDPPSRVLLWHGGKLMLSNRTSKMIG